MTGGYSCDTGLPFGQQNKVKVSLDYAKSAATVESLENRLHNPPADGTPNAFFDPNSALMQPTGDGSLLNAAADPNSKRHFSAARCADSTANQEAYEVWRSRPRLFLPSIV